MIDFLVFGNRIWKYNMEAGVGNDSRFLIALNMEIRYLVFVPGSCTFAVSTKQMLCCDSASY